jgi:hypothetical protein
MTFLLRTLRDWFVTLEAIALQNPALFNIPPKLIRIHTHDQIMATPFSTTSRRNRTQSRSYQLNEASVTDASATPPTIGRREPTTQGVGICHKVKEGN